MIRRRLATTLVATAALMGATLTAGAANPWESADIYQQGSSTEVEVHDGAEIRRTAKGLTAKVSMPTPEPGSYEYPTGATASGVPGHPEMFSLWVFIFFNPDACIGNCDGSDLQSADPNVIAGAFNAGGHVVGGPNLSIAGRVNEQSVVFGGPNAETISEALSLGYTLADAEIHLAVAPHGALAPDLLPDAIKTPVGDPSFWWVALFK